MSNDQLPNLVKMMNQIADNAGSGGDVDAVVSHVTRFWARPMKAKIIAYLQQGGEDLNPIAKRALEQIAG